MIISWYGHSCFKIQTRPKRGENEVIIFTDPFNKKIGLRSPAGNADIVTVSHSHSDHNNTSAFRGEPFTIDATGEYSIKGVHIEGIGSFHDNEEGAQRGRNTIFIFESEELRIAHLGDIGHILSERQVDTIGDLDVLMIPIGGNYTIDAKTAKEVIGQLEPKIIIPMHYMINGLKADIVDVSDEKEFLKLMGTKSNGAESKLVLKKKDLGEMENHLFVMKPIKR